MENQLVVLDNTSNEKTLWTIKELAEALDKSEPTVKAWLDKVGIVGTPDESGEHGKGRLMRYPVTPENLILFKEEEEEILKTRLAAEKQVAKLSAKAKAIAALEVINDMDEDKLHALAMAAMQEACRRAKEREATLEAKTKQLEVAIEEKTIALEEHAEWASVEKPMGVFGFWYNWRPLKKYSEAHGFQRPKVPHHSYEDGIRAYHKDVWMAVYGVDIINWKQTREPTTADADPRFLKR